jgi:hypothetical protein
MHEDDANAWMAGLDWSLYRRSRQGFLSQRLFLPRAIEMFGEQICAPWPQTDFLIGEAGNEHREPIVDSSEAFLEDGTPVHSLHAAFSPAVRREAERFALPIVSADAITQDEWESIYVEHSLANGLGMAARRAVAGLAPIIAKAAMEERIATWARPLGGGDARSVPITPDMWDLDYDTLIRRFAACGLSIDHPHDAQAPVNHLIFVDHAKLQNEIIHLARENYVPIAFSDERLWRRVDHYAVIVDEVAAFLVELMSRPDHVLNNEQLKGVVENRFGRSAGGRVFERAKAIAVAQPGLEKHAAPGRKRGVPLPKRDPMHPTLVR